MTVTIIKLIGALVIAVSIIISATTSNVPLIITATIISSSLFYFLEPILEYTKMQKKRRERLKQIKKFILNIQQFFHNFTKINIDLDRLSNELSKEEVDLNSFQIIDKIVESNFKNSTPTIKNGIILTTFCYIADKENNPIAIAEYKKSISDISSAYHLMTPDTDSVILMNMYDNYTKNLSLNIINNHLNYNEVFDKFSKKYDPIMNLALKMHLSKEQEAELRKTLARLLEMGKIDLGQLGKDILTKVGEEVNKKSKTSKAYILLSNKFYKLESIQKAIKKFPQIRFSRKMPYNLPDGIKYLHMTILYPGNNYDNPQDFLDKVIIPNIPIEERNKGFISIIPFEGTEIFSFPRDGTEIDNENIRNGYDAINSIRTGTPIKLSNILFAGIKSEIGIHSILSIIPFNIFLPDLSDRVRTFIINNYDRLKNKFKIAVLSDWARIEDRDLSTEMIKIDSETGKKRVRNDQAWTSIAQKIVEAAKKHRDAIYH